MRRLYLIIYSVFCMLSPLLAQENATMPVAGKRPKVALVLGGGGAKGAAEVGVLKHLERLGLKFDLVVGTSIGSIVGGLYCSGVDASTMEHLFCTQEWIDLFTDRKSSLKGEIYTQQDGVDYVLGFPVRRAGKKVGSIGPAGAQVGDKPAKKAKSKTPGLGLLKGDSITSLLGRVSGYTHEMCFDSLPVPYRCVAVDVKTMKEVVFSEGCLPEAMRASMAIPGIFRPFRVEEYLLIDGGTINNLPVDVARSWGADIIIAVDLCQEMEMEDDSKSWLEEQLGDIDLGGHLNWIIRRPDNKKYRANLAKADVLIRPNILEFDVASFNLNAIKTMIERGETAAMAATKQLEEIKKRTE